MRSMKSVAVFMEDGALIIALFFVPTPGDDLTAQESRPREFAI